MDAFTWEVVAAYEVRHGQPSWAMSHFQCPTALPLDDKTVRVYVSCRDSNQVARIGFLDLDFNSDHLARCSPLHPEPALSSGAIGCFDEHGVYSSTALRINDEIKLFYAGYARGAEPPMFYTSIGVASSKDGRHFERMSQAPIMTRSEHDPCLVTSPGIYRLGSKWVMYYVSGFGWFRNQVGQLQSLYDIKIAWSDDLNVWQRYGEVAIPLINGETNISRPTVMMDDAGVHHMWFCCVPRGGAYRIGYARSRDGIKWARMDSLSGFANENSSSERMQAYPHVFRFAGQVWMLLNEGRYGDAGFSLLKMHINRKDQR
jgi:predicted GH43/DUF377 family glycosyl hydrolase